jgi:hypothetical protein
MSAVATKPAEAIRGRDLAGAAQHLFESSGSTLEDRILGAWEDLAATGRASCPVCAGTLEPTGCAGCGSELS